MGTRHASRKLAMQVLYQSLTRSQDLIDFIEPFIDESEFDLDKNIIKGIFKDLYRQACEVE